MSPQHYTKNTESVSHFCKVCNRLTIHKVYDGRLGPCVEEHHKDKPKKKPGPENTQQDLFQSR